LDQKQLIEDNINLVYAVIHKHYPTFVNDEDIIQSGRVGLCRAAKNWIQDKGEFSTYAWGCIRNEIRAEFRNRNKSSGTLSLDYEVSSGDGDTISFGDLLVGEQDVSYVDVDRLYQRLDLRGREIFELFQSGKSTREIVSDTGYNINVIRKYIRQIKLLLNKEC
jgi:RNA polymerase sigma factor (sigma-70 family)